MKHGMADIARLWEYVGLAIRGLHIEIGILRMPSSGMWCCVDLV
jgi:hypothetical protein